MVDSPKSKWRVLDLEGLKAHSAYKVVPMQLIVWTDLQANAEREGLGD